jgi:SAM-dependent methyltransferase
MTTADNSTDDLLYRDPDLVQFYDLENGWAADSQYCARLAEQAHSVLDLGCGTGLLAAALGTGRDVAGVDPAAAMLDVARRRPGGEAVEWVEADARTVRLDRSFDLVLLTGHAFQVFLTPADRRAVLATIAAHLAPGGRFIFDMRNPACEKWREWQSNSSQRLLAHPQFGRVKAWNEATQDAATGIVTYHTHYELSDGRRFSAASQIAFPSQREVAGLLVEVGLCVDGWLGDWQGGPLEPTAPEIIPIGRRA